MTTSNILLKTKGLKPVLGLRPLKPLLLMAVLAITGNTVSAQEDTDELTRAAESMSNAITRIEKAALASQSGDEAAFNDLAASVETFNNQVKQLGTEDISSTVNSNLTSRWRIVKTAAQAIIDAGPQVTYITGIAQELDSNLLIVQQQLADAITALQASQAPATSVGAAQDSLWLTEKIARNINRLETFSGSSRSISNALIDDSNAYERNLNALMNGDKTLGIQYVGKGRALNAIKSASSLFTPITRAAKDIAKAAAGLSKANKARDQLMAGTTPLMQAIHDLTTSPRGSDSKTFNLTTTMAIAAGIALLIALPLLLLYTRQGKKLRYSQQGVADVRRALIRLSTGDLTTKVPEDNSVTREIAREINNVTERQRDLVRNVQDPFGLSVQELGKISAAIRGQAEKGKVWAGTMLKSTTAASDMLALSEEIKNATSDAARTSERNRQRVERGYELTKDMSRASADVRQSLQNTSKSAKRQGELIQSVTSAVEYIQALNTKISVVAINTRIEAEKAGEHGRPFLGIAESIADLLREAEEEGRRIISEVRMLQNMSADSLSSMENTVGTVVTILEYVDKLDSSLEEIYTDSSNISGSISAAEEGASRSADKAQNLNSAIARISDRSTEVTVMSESAHASITNLQSSMNKVADKLRQIKVERSYADKGGNVDSQGSDGNTNPATAANSDSVTDSIPA